MTGRLILSIAAILGPAIGTTSLAHDRAYYHAAHAWQTSSPPTYYLHTTVVILLAAILVKHHWRPPDPHTPRGTTIGGTGRSEWNRRL